MTQGYVTLAVDTESGIEIKQAVTLAISLKMADPSREVCLLTDKFSTVPKKYEGVFDYIVEFPYGNFDTTEDGLINIWQLYYSTPFDQTLYIDRRSLVLSNTVQSMWDTFEHEDYVFSKSVSNFRGERISMKHSFYIHERNEIPTFYTNVFYFNKSERSMQFFKMLDVTLKDFRRVYLQQLSSNRPAYFDLNLIINLTIKMLGETTSIHGHIPYTLISLDNILTDDEDLPSDWVEYLSHWMSNDILKINNHRQTGIVCYNSNNFLDEEIINDYRKRYSISKINI